MLAFCLESTGPYHQGPALFLAQAGERVSVENPRRVKAFGAAAGALGKTDAADARLIARYGQRMRPAPWSPPPPALRELRALDRRLGQLDGMLNQERNRLEDPLLEPEALRSVRAVEAALLAERERVLQRLRELVQSDPDLARDVALLTSIPGVGERVAAGFLAETAGCAAFEEAQDAAAYAGLSPRLEQSGKKEGHTHLSKQGNPRLRARLYMAAVVAKAHNPLVKDLYERLLKKGMPKKAALGACMRKLAMLCYGVLKTGKPFDPNHGRT